MSRLPKKKMELHHLMGNPYATFLTLYAESERERIHSRFDGKTSNAIIYDDKNELY